MVEHPVGGERCEYKKHKQQYGKNYAYRYPLYPQKGFVYLLRRSERVV